MTDLPESVTEAMSQEAFDVLNFVTGYGTPVSSVEIYANADAGYRLAQLVERERAIAAKAEVEGLSIAEDADWVDPDEVEAIKTEIEDSALTFKLQAIAPGAKETLRERLAEKHSFDPEVPVEDQEAFFREYTLELAAATIKSVTHKASGKVDESPWTPERVEALRVSLYEYEFQRLDRAVYALNFEGDVFERAVSADFLSKR